MSRFVPPHDKLDLRELGTDRFQLLRPLWYESEVLGGRIVKVPSGFVYDRESIPRCLPIVYAWLAGTASRAGTVHDRLVQVHKVGDFSVDRAVADAVYYEATGVDGNGWLKRWIKWLGVRVGGAAAWASGPSRFRVIGNERRQRPRMDGSERREVLDKLKGLRGPQAP